MTEEVKPLDKANATASPEAQQTAATHRSTSETMLSEVHDFTSAAWRSAVVDPINGVSSLVSDAVIQPLAGVSLPKIHETSLTDSDSIGSKVGGALGMVAPFLLSRYGVQKMSGLAGLTNEAGLVRFGQNAATGAIMGSVFTPTSGPNHWLDRLQNTAVDAGTFGAMGVVGDQFLAKFGSTAEMPALEKILRGSAIGAASGIQGGFVNAELNSLVHGKGIADNSDVLNQMETFGAFGAFAGGLDAAYRHIGESHTEAPPTRETSEQTERQQGDQALTEMARRFPIVSEAQLARGRAQVESELAEVKAAPRAGREMSVLDKLNESPLDATQRERVLNSLAMVREHYVSTLDPATQRLEPDQEKNWIHTQGEFGHVLDSTLARNLTPAQTEDALLGSMFSDAVKNKTNFMVHHLAGAQAAAEVLPRFQDAQFTPERIHGIEQAIKEHQIGPPGFMSNIYTGNIRSGLAVERMADMRALEATDPATRTPEMDEQLRALRYKAEMERNFITPDENEALNSLAQKIANPMTAELTDTADGGKGLALTDLERSLLSRTGNTEWYVPSEGTPWYESSRALINGDSLDNYTTAGGYSKLFGLNGPETDVYFRFPTTDLALQSPKTSYVQASNIMTDEGRALSKVNLAETESAIASAKGRTEQWLRETLNVPAGEPLPEIPYWNSPLRYPDRGLREPEWWTQHKLPENQRLPFYEEQRYATLSPQEIEQFKFAKVMRDHLVSELRKEQRVNGDLPPDFQPVMSGSR